MGLATGVGLVTGVGIASGVGDGVVIGTGVEGGSGIGVGVSTGVFTVGVPLGKGTGGSRGGKWVSGLLSGFVFDPINPPTEAKTIL